MSLKGRWMTPAKFVYGPQPRVPPAGIAPHAATSMRYPQLRYGLKCLFDSVAVDGARDRMRDTSISSEFGKF